MSSQSSVQLQIRHGAIIITVLTLSAFLLYTVNYSNRLSSGSFSPSFFPFDPKYSSPPDSTQELEQILKKASMGNKTVILTYLNDAWASPGSILDVFLKSFKLGYGTQKLLDHLVIVALGQKAYTRCRMVHKHCYALVTEGAEFQQEASFMTPTYLKMMWRRLDFLRSILELGYTFVFTDTDIVWFRDPFPRFFPDADFQIASDHFFGISEDINNSPNAGFLYIKGNPFISEIGLKIRFLDTAYFGGLCEQSRDLNVVCTMHVNCCIGMDPKLTDLKIILQDWRAFMSLPSDLKNQSIISWRVPHKCSL